MSDPPPSGPPDDFDVRDAFKKAVAMAAEDPQAFRVEARAFAKQLGVTVGELYRRVQQREEIQAGDQLVNRAISAVAQRLKKELGI